MLAQTHSTLAILGNKGEEVEGTGESGYPDESKRDAVTIDEFGSVLGQVAESGDECTAATEANLEGDANATPQVPGDY